MAKRKVRIRKPKNENKQDELLVNKKKTSKKKKAAIIIVSIVAVLVALAVGVIIYLSSIYNKMYVPVDIVDRTNTYVMPEYPELDYYTNAVDGTNDPVESAIPGETEGADASGDTPPDQWVDSPDYEEIPVNPDYNGNSQGSFSVDGSVPIYRENKKNPNITNILLMGTDSRDVHTDRGRSDTMIVLSYNNVTGQIKLLSFLRDSLVPIEGHDWHRLNSAYAYGGVGLCINTINQLFDLDVQEFVVIDMNGTTTLIDYIGGVDVYLTQAEVDYYRNLYGTNFKEGICHLDGDMALKHMRNRKLDSDFGRTRRQRDVITSVINKVLSTRSLAEALDLMNYATTMVRTNIEALDMANLVTQVVGQKDIVTIDTQHVPFSGAYNYAWYRGMAIISFDIQGAASRVNSYLYG